MIDTALYNLLADDAGVAALVGTRIYRIASEQNPTYPLILYNRVSTSKSHHSTGDGLLDFVVYEIECLHETSHETCRTLARAVKDAIDTYSGTKSTVVIKSILLADDRDLSLPASEGESLPLFRIMQTYRISFIPS